ncbi:hypothetical protein EI94DRAFT_1748191 [Lactarius quietus]|nr:hypothetical protein EI94DRAFT_1748191 [Lactarius quietus]
MWNNLDTLVLVLTLFAGVQRKKLSAGVYFDHILGRVSPGPSLATFNFLKLQLTRFFALLPCSVGTYSFYHIIS